MAFNWISRRRLRHLGQRLADLYNPPSVAGSSYATDDWDADARRMHSELDAIRVRFPDHA